MERPPSRRGVAVFDAAQLISKGDKQLCDYVAEQYKPCVFVANKWDLLADGMPTERWVNYLRDTFRTMVYVPIAFITGQTGENVKAMLNHAQMLFKQARTRIGTAQLNKLVRAAIERNPPPTYQNRRSRIYYATQVAEQPPTIVLFCSDPSAIRSSTSATCWAQCARRSVSPRCPSSFTCGNASRAIAATRSTPRSKARTRRPKPSRRRRPRDNRGDAKGARPAGQRAPPGGLRRPAIVLA